MAAVGETEAGDREAWVEVVAGGEEPSRLQPRCSWGLLRAEERELMGPDG